MFFSIDFSLIYVVFRRFQRCSPNLSLSVDVTPVLIIGNPTKVAGYILTSKNKSSSSFRSNVISDEAFYTEDSYLFSFSCIKMIKMMVLLNLLISCVS